MIHPDELPRDPEYLDEMAADQAGWYELDYDPEELNGQLPLFASAQPEHVQEPDLAQGPYGAIDREEDEDDGLPFWRSGWK